jgi:predicted ATPase
MAMLAFIALAFDEHPPFIVCFEEIDRGLHPRMLREMRDLLYRLSYPSATGENRAPVQVVATTQSPYLLDLFRDHPEEVVILQKGGGEARFERLADRADLPELMKEGSLGDMWFAGILGGVPEDS